MGRIFPPVRKDFRLPENFVCMTSQRRQREEISALERGDKYVRNYLHFIHFLGGVRCNFSCVLCCSHSYETCGIFLVGEMLQQQPHHLYAAPFFKQKYLFSREEVCNMLQRNFALIDIHTIRREIWVKPHDHTTTTSLQQEVTFCTNMPSAFQLTFASKSRKK